MRNWINLFEQQPAEASDVFVLPAHTVLYHATSGDWPRDQIRGPAWFGRTPELAAQYHAVMGHEQPRLLKYETTRPLRLMRADGPGNSEMLDALYFDSVHHDDVAAAVLGKYEGWVETDGEVMIGDTSAVRFIEQL